MNYRHVFHAGNHCDVLKHAALRMVLDALLRKDKPFAVLDAFAGRGRYDLSSGEAARSGEHLGGVSAIFGEQAPPATLAPYLDAVRKENPSGRLRWYPGSPVLIANAVRPGDRLTACELHPSEAQSLRIALETWRNARVDQADGYEAVRRVLPFPERRGLVLIDPPFERPGEFDRLVQALADAKKRFETGVVMVWSPIKDAAGRRVFEQGASELAFRKTLEVDLRIKAAADGLTGSSLFVVNPPFGLARDLSRALPWLARRLAVAAGGGWRVLEQEAGAVVFNAGEALESP